MQGEKKCSHGMNTIKYLYSKTGTKYGNTNYRKNPYSPVKGGKKHHV